MSPPTSDFGTVTINTSSSATNFTVTNSGEETSGSISAIVSGAAASDFTVANSCSTLAGAGTCIVSVTFSPTAPGAKTASLIVSGSPGGTVMATLNGAAVNPGTLSLAPQGNQSFGNVIVGATGTFQTFTVTNSGGVTTGTLTVTPAGSDPNQFTKSNDTCNGMTLAAGANCTFRVNFAPTSTGAKAATFIVAGSPGGSVTATVSGNGVDDANIAGSPTIGGFGTVTIGQSSSDVTFTFTNTGDLPTSALLAPVTAPAGEYTITSQNCTGVVLTPNGGNSCNVLVRFTPVAAGNRPGTLTVSATTGGTEVVNLSGTGNTVGSLSVTPNPFAYGNVTVGQTSNNTFTVTNTGGSAVGPLVATVSGEFTIVAGQDACTGVTLAAVTGSCTVVVAFAPTSGGAETGTLTVSGGAGSPASASLTGTGIVAANIASSSPSHDFGSVVLNTASAPFTFTITNDGGVASSVPTVGVSGPNAAQFAANNMCTAALAPGASCTVTVTFTPTTVGPKMATLDVSITPGNALALGLSGDGITNAQIVAAPSALPFNDTFVGDSSQQIFTVTNNGSVTTGTIVITETGANQADFSQTNNCTTLTNGQSCTVTVTFAPTATGARTNTFSVTGTPGGTTTVAVSGNGVPRIQVTDPTSNPFDFGTQTINGTNVCRNVSFRNNTSTTQTFTLAFTNFQDFPTADATNDYYTASPSGGIFPIDCRSLTSLPAAGSCSFQVCFDPQTVGTQPGNVTMTVGAGGAANQASLDLTGVGTTGALTISPGDVLGPVALTPFVYADTITGTTTSQVFTVSNQSGAATVGNLQIGQTGDGTFHLVSDMCSGSPLANNATCTFTVVFAPTATVTSNGTLTARDQSSTTVANAAIRGNGITAADLEFGAAGVYGDVYVGQQSGIITSVLRNDGSQVTGPITITVTGSPEYTYLTNAAGDCISGTTVLTAFTNPPTNTVCPAGATCSCNVRTRFNPVTVHAGTVLQPMSITATASPGGTDVSAQAGSSSISTISIAPNAGTNFGDVPLGTTEDLLFTVSNSSQQALTFGSGLATNGEFTTVSNGCGTLAAAPVGGPATTCTIGVRFAPVGSPGPRTGVSYTVNMTNGIAIQTGLTGNAREIATITVNPSSYDFGSILAGGLGTPPSTTKLFTVTNTGFQTSGQLAYSTAGSTAFSIIPGGSCGASGTTALAGADVTPAVNPSSCTILVQFAPMTGQTGSLSGMLNVTVPVGAGNSASSVLLGNGLANGNVTIINTTDASAGPTADFGSQALNTTGTTQVFNVLNTSGATVTLLLTFPADFVRVNTGIVSNCAATLAPGANCNVGAAFAPTSSFGAKSGQLVVVTGVYAALNGIALSNPNFGPLPDQNYGPVDINVAGGVTRTLTIVNNNTGTTGMLSAALTGVQANQFGTSGCAVSLAPGESCILSVTFDPDTTGVKTATLTLSSANGLSLVAMLSGTGVNAPSLSIAPTTSQADGSRPLGQLDTTPTVFTITNAAGSATSGQLVFSTTGDTNDFVLTAPGTGTPCNTTGTQTLGDGASCTFGVFFHPTTSTGAKTFTVTVNPGTGGGGTVTGTVTGTATDFLTLTTPNTAGVVTLTPNANTTLTFTNNSSVATRPVVVNSTLLGTQVALIMDNCFNVSIPAGGTCTAIVRYVPDGTTNPTNGRYVISTTIDVTTAGGYPQTTAINSPTTAPLEVFFSP